MRRVSTWIVAVAAMSVVALAVQRPAIPQPPVANRAEFDVFVQKYGPNRNSQDEEEWFIRDYFKDRRGGTFVDVGANHYRNSSKTYYLETALGWSGLAIEPQRDFSEGYARNRPRTKFLPFFISDVSNKTARLYIIDKKREVSSSDPAFVQGFGTPDEVREVPTLTLNDLLDAQRLRRLDFLSIDVELHEPKVLKGFDIDRFKPSLVCIEALGPVRQQILNYFAEHRYVLVGKYVWVDLQNMYFAPLDEMQRAAK